MWTFYLLRFFFLFFWDWNYNIIYFFQIINYFGYLIITFILSYICYIFFQVPYMYLESLILKKSPRIEDDSSDKDIEKDFKVSDSNNLSVSAKTLRRHMQTLTISSIKDSHHISLGKAGRKESQERL